MHFKIYEANDVTAFECMNPESLSGFVFFLVLVLILMILIKTVKNNGILT